MKHIALIAAALATLSSPVLAQTRADEQRMNDAQVRFDREVQIYRQSIDEYRSAARRTGDGRPPYDNNRYGNDDRNENGYDPARDYRAGPQYRERVLAADDRVYRGNDGQYYCKRSDGTTGLIIGAAGGGILGNVIDGGHSRAAGTLLGAALGALAGRAVDQNSSQNQSAAGKMKRGPAIHSPALSHVRAVWRTHR